MKKASITTRTLRVRVLIARSMRRSSLASARSSQSVWEACSSEHLLEGHPALLSDSQRVHEVPQQY